VNTNLIQSRQNPKIKFLTGLRKKRDRDQHGCFLIEGKKELENFIQSGRKLEELFTFEENWKETDQAFLKTAKKAVQDHYELSEHAFEKISFRENPDGWLGMARSWNTRLEDLQLSENPLLLVLEGTEKPGNLGAILRTANSFGVDAIICNDPLVDLFNPNVIRASRGLLFSTQIAKAENRETVVYLQKHNIQTVATICEGGTPTWSQDLTQPIAFVMGNEALGLSEYWFEQAKYRTSIPSPGKADSLNLSTATSICLYEAIRQRNS
jgi:TrmH family RNA methyltransferase